MALDPESNVLAFGTAWVAAELLPKPESDILKLLQLHLDGGVLEEAALLKSLDALAKSRAEAGRR